MSAEPDRVRDLEARVKTLERKIEDMLWIIASNSAAVPVRNHRERFPDPAASVPSVPAAAPVTAAETAPTAPAPAVVPALMPTPAPQAPAAALMPTPAPQAPALVPAGAQVPAATAVPVDAPDRKRSWILGLG